MIDYIVERKLAEISRTDRTAKRLTLISWHGHPAKLDLRIWNLDEEKPGKGITLTQDEAEALAKALNGFLSGL